MANLDEEEKKARDANKAYELDTLDLINGYGMIDPPTFMNEPI